ncbi:hypothetical protein [Helicobacter sp. T3_23-1059]
MSYLKTTPKVSKILILVILRELAQSISKKQQFRDISLTLNMTTYRLPRICYANARNDGVFFVILSEAKYLYFVFWIF